MSIITLKSGKAKDPSMSLPSQAQIVMMTIAKLCDMKINNKVDSEKVIASLTCQDLHTRQSVKRIVSYYMPTLREQGYIDYESARNTTLILDLK